MVTKEEEVNVAEETTKTEVVEVTTKTEVVEEKEENEGLEEATEAEGEAGEMMVSKMKSIIMPTEKKWMSHSREQRKISKEKRESLKRKSPTSPENITTILAKRNSLARMVRRELRKCRQEIRRAK